MARLVSYQPRYIVLAQSLMDAIGAGKFPVGSLMPTEHDIALQHSVSRHTVREALRLLQDQGMITRQAGIGTRVTSAEPLSNYVQTDVGTSDLRRYVQDHALAGSEGWDGIVELGFDRPADFFAFMAEPMTTEWLFPHESAFIDIPRGRPVITAPNVLFVREPVA